MLARDHDKDLRNVLNNCKNQPRQLSLWQMKRNEFNVEIWVLIPASACVFTTEKGQRAVPTKQRVQNPSINASTEDKPELERKNGLNHQERLKPILKLINSDWQLDL